MKKKKKKVKENQFYLQGPVPGWFMCRRGPLMSAIDLPFLTSSPRPVSAPARGWLCLISVMQASEKPGTWNGWRKQGCLFVAADDDDHSVSLAGCFLAHRRGRRGKGFSDGGLGSLRLEGFYYMHRCCDP